MKLFRTGSPNTVYDCQVNFGFLPAKYQILIRTAKFLQKFIASENSLCTLFISDAGQQLRDNSCNSVKIFKLHVSCAMPFIEKILTVNVCCIAFVYCASDFLSFSLS